MTKNHTEPLEESQSPTQGSAESTSEWDKTEMAPHLEGLVREKAVNAIACKQEKIDWCCTKDDRSGIKIRCIWNVFDNYIHDYVFIIWRKTAKLV